MSKQPVWNFFRISWFGLLVLAILITNGRPEAQAKTANANEKAERSGILWQDPQDIAARDLLYGIGGGEDAPQAESYTFVKEDLGESSPKFVVKDSNGVRWKVKLGPEARGEIAATRLVWAAGYFTDEDYYLPQLRVKDLPGLRRGKEFVSLEGIVSGARMEREIEGQKKVGSWKWKGEPALNPQELNGLKVMMALINNWDLKDVNNAIYKRESAQGEARYIYVVSDLGASFGRTHLDHAKTKWNLADYESSKFIGKGGPEDVRFATPGSPSIFLMVNPFDYLSRRRLMTVTGEVSRTDARRVGELLSRLSAEQIRDAFRAAGFSFQETDDFARVVEQRIGTLRQL
jgi:hypothetical protein